MLLSLHVLSNSLIVHDKTHYSYERDEKLKNHKVDGPD